jgi:hypothetical protein
MAFPSSPTNNQVATVNGIQYVYNTTATSWTRQANTSLGTAVAAAYSQANTAFSNAAGASLYANGAFIKANTATTDAAGASLYANAAFTQANTANTRAYNTVLKAGDTMTGTLNVPTINVSSLATFFQTTDVIVPLSGATGTVTHDTNNGSVFYHTTPAANFTANFTNIPTTDNRTFVVTLIVSQGATPYIPNAVQIGGAGQTIKWINSTAPTGTASKVEIFSFSLVRTDSSWSQVLGQSATYG